MNSYPPIPASPFMLDHLLGLLFLIHLVFINYLMAAPLLTTWHLWFVPGAGRQVAKWLAAPLPVMFTFAITFGVAVLLFVQVLFSERFFTANVILGGFWLAVILLLMLAFYGSYVLKKLAVRETGGRVLGGAMGLMVAALVWSIAIIMVSNYFITTDRALWPMLLEKPWRVLGQSSYLPRLLHFVTGSFAVTGFWMFWIAQWRARRGAAESAVRLFRRRGLWLATVATGVQISVGVWLLIWSPVAVWDYLFSGTFLSLVWISGVATGMLLLGLLIVASVFPDRLIWGRLATALLGWTMFGMIAGREAVRLVSFGPDAQFRNMPYAAQPGAMALFAGIAVLGVLVLLWLGWLVWRLPKSEVSAE